MFCIECMRGFHSVCGEPCCCSESKPTVDVELPDVSDEPEEWRISSGGAKRGKRDAALKDQQSTGRKRAAQMLPLDRDDLCMWHDASPTNPKGGGVFPIVFGCENKQNARHHGPDKNTLNNDLENLNAICHWHHNNWHAMNDPVYIPGNPIMFQVSDEIKRDPTKIKWWGPKPGEKVPRAPKEED